MLDVPEELKQFRNTKRFDKCCKIFTLAEDLIKQQTFLHPV